ncbi:putative fatty acyl-CoA reductase CG5065 [Cydia strobilella]|uniref:putative fatty acyl-CoA reductase CG5065 n=1 Tax=Cydia strobilella TaxID=1100964 RepID=UPI003007B1B6
MSTIDPAVAQELESLSRHRAIDEAIARGDSAVQEFYKNAVIFVTGGSGFLGKQLIEKLFRSCDIKSVYLLLREKKGQTSQERIAKIFQDPVFEILHKRKPDFVSRVTPVNGDITQLRMAISDQDWYTMVNEVTVIFHAAATITFDEPLRVATRTNVRGTMQALLLGKDCKNLKSFVHVSTAYAHATHSRIGGTVREDFYDSPGDPRTMVDLVEQLSEEKLAAIKPKLIEDWPNTYAYTKALAEEAVRTMSGDLPICIVRPAIVIASNLEPSPGWVDMSSVYGPSGLLLGSGLGVMHTFMAEDGAKIDLIPVDYVNNATIVAGWATAERRKNGQKDIKIYTVSPARNPITWRKYIMDYVNNATIVAGWATAERRKNGQKDIKIYTVSPLAGPRQNAARTDKRIFRYIPCRRLETLLRGVSRYNPNSHGVDYVNNATIVGGWATAERRKNGLKDIKIYTVSPARNPITWREILNIMFTKVYYCASSPKAVWYVFVHHTSRWWVFCLLTCLMHFIPGYLADGVLTMLGKKPKAMKLYQLAFNLSSVLAYFTCHEFHFQDDNLVKLHNSLSKTDQDLYNFDVEKMDWTQQMITWAIGLRKYIIKDGLKDTEYAVKKQRVLQLLSYGVGALYLYAIYKLITLVCWVVCLFVAMF